MARERQFSELITEAKQRADMENHDFVDDEEWRTYLNQGFQELWDVILDNEGHEFLAASYTLSTTAGTKTYDLQETPQQGLPVDIYLLLGVDFQTGTGEDVPLRPASFWERHWGDDDYDASWGNLPRYRMLGKHETDKDYTPQIRFTSDPGATTVTIWYVPYPPYFALSGTDDSNAVDAFNGWEVYVTIYAAIQALIKEESDPTALYNELARAQKRIVSMVNKKHSAAPEQVVDMQVRHVNEGGSGGGGAIPL